jgi:hypothetical protein
MTTQQCVEEKCTINSLSSKRTLKIYPHRFCPILGKFLTKIIEKKKNKNKKKKQKTKKTNAICVNQVNQ